MSSTRELISEAYRAFNRRDIDGVLALMHRDVDWPNGMEGGRVHGHDAVREYWTRQWKQVDPHVEPVGFEEDGEDTVVEVHQVIHDVDGKLLMDRMVKHVYTIGNGLITKMDIREK